MMNIVIPMAGLGSRFSSVGLTTPKPLLIVNGKTLLEHSVDSLGLSGRYIFITREYNNPQYNIEMTKIFDRIAPGYVEIRVGDIQYGAADSSLYARNYIDNDDELIVTNCDQLLNWRPDEFISFIKENNPDGVIVTHESTNPKHSYAAILGSKVTYVVEKNPISHNALIGVHYWKHGKDFVESASDLMRNYRKMDMPEAYISTTYNYMIDSGKVVLPWHVADGSYIPLGTPEDVGIYLLRQENK